MKKFSTLLIMLIAFSTTAQESEIRSAIDTFFEGFHAKDTVKMKSVFSGLIVFHTISEKVNGAKLSQEDASEVCRSIAKIPAEMKFEERLLSYKIDIDGKMAHVWTPYEFYVNGKLSHTGVNSFQMFKENENWKIVHCIDTRRKPL